MSTALAEVADVDVLLKELDEIMVRLADHHPAFEAMAVVVYEHERQWFDSSGGDWAELAPSTQASKRRRGYPPDKPLIAAGTLQDSASSPTGEWSVQLITGDFMQLGIDWEKDGWQIPVILSEGRENTPMPGRAIYELDVDLVGQLTEIEVNFLRGAL